MGCYYYTHYLLVEEFATPPRLRQSEKRDKELKLIKELDRQYRRIIIDPYGEVIPSDQPLYEALIHAGYELIAVVVVVGNARPIDIKFAKAFAAKQRLPDIRPARIRPNEPQSKTS
jgi:hypothetical protein